MQKVQETQFQSLGWEDTLEEKMATCSSTLAWKIRGARQATVHGVAELDTTEQLNSHTHTHIHTHTHGKLRSYILQGNLVLTPQIEKIASCNKDTAQPK